MPEPAVPPALAAALLSALIVTTWALWPTPAPPPARAVPAEADQFPGMEPADCIRSSATPAHQEVFE